VKTSRARRVISTTEAKKVISIETMERMRSLLGFLSGSEVVIVASLWCFDWDLFV